jgi:hypothetical protein
MPLPSFQELSSALHIGTFASTLLTETNLSAAVQRQIRQAAFEYIRLREEHFGCDSRESHPDQWFMATRCLLDFFEDAAKVGKPQDEILEASREMKRTLREIRTLRGTKHFFSEHLDQFFKALAMLQVSGDYFNQFASNLYWELKKYREKRKVEEDLFLAPFHRYMAELMAIIEPVRSAHGFTHFDVEPRIKRDLLAKQAKRQWQDMQEFYDLVGIRIIVGNRREVDAAVALVEGALRVHEASAILDPRVEHYFRVDHIEVNEPLAAIDPELHRDETTGFVRRKYNNRGYRNPHMNVRRHCRDNGHDHPTAEVQPTTPGRLGWGERQRVLLKKSWGYPLEGPVDNYNQIPPELRTVMNAYCYSVSEYIEGVENGEKPDAMPDLGDNIMLLTRIKDEVLRSEYLDRICDMDTWMSNFPNGNGSATAA